MKSRSTYGDPFKPLLEGSGGGAQWTDRISKNGRGGGAIYFEAYNLTLIDTNLTSDGSSFIHNLYYGSPSGGAVQLRTFDLHAVNSTISANGGGAVTNDFG